MKKTILTLFALILSLALLAGCGQAVTESGKQSQTSAGFTSSAQSQEEEPSSQAASQIDTSVSERDASGTYESSGASVLSPEGDLTITSAGTYILSGTYTDKTVTVDAGDEDKVQIVLQNAGITNENGPAIYVRNADKVFITAAEGTVNTISDGSDYSVTDDDTELDAAIFSKDDLTVNGEGKLTVTGNYKHGIVSKDDLVITAKDLTVSAEKVALDGKDSVNLTDAAVTLTAGTDAIRADNDTDADKGYVAVSGSTIAISAGKDGIQAETVFTSEDSVISIVSGGGSGAKNSDSEESYKGIKAGTSVAISGGSYEIDSLDDAIHTNGTIAISDGTFKLTSADDAVHADEKIEISGGTFTISAAEGIESTYVLISGGDITIEATDDGINAAAKSSKYTPTVEITGGVISVTMGPGDTDGIDSNGNIIISGGTISVNANSAFDYDGSVSFTDGTVYVNGQQVTSIQNQFGGGMGGFGGQPGQPGQPGQQQGGFGPGGGKPGRM